MNELREKIKSVIDIANRLFVLTDSHDGCDCDSCNEIKKLKQK